MKEIKMPEKVKMMSTSPSGSHCTFSVPRHLGTPIIKAIIKDTYDMVDIMLNGSFWIRDSDGEMKFTTVGTILVLAESYQIDICSNVVYGLLLPSKEAIKMIF